MATLNDFEQGSLYLVLSDSDLVVVEMIFEYQPDEGQGWIEKYLHEVWRYDNQNRMDHIWFGEDDCGWDFEHIQIIKKLPCKKEQFDPYILMELKDKFPEYFI
jgi:hypothetical protein